MKYYILFGPPGAGKGTQAATMVKEFNLHHISTGALLRKEIAAGTELGKEAAKLIDKGNLVPDEIVEAMIENEFETVSGVDGFILDGFPRTLPQAEVLDKIVNKKGESVTAVISIMIPDTVVKERILHRAAIEGRADDADEAIIENRIRTYHKQTEPLIEYYTAKGKYHEVDGDSAIDKVGEAIVELMKRL